MSGDPDKKPEGQELSIPEHVVKHLGRAFDSEDKKDPW